MCHLNVDIFIITNANPCGEENLSIVPPELKATTQPCDVPESADNHPKRRAPAHYTLFKGAKVLSQSVGGVEIT